MTCLKIEVKVFKANKTICIKQFCQSISGIFFAVPFLLENANQDLLENSESCRMDNLIEQSQNKNW